MTRGPFPKIGVETQGNVLSLNLIMYITLMHLLRSETILDFSRKSWLAPATNKRSITLTY